MRTEPIVVTGTGLATSLGFGVETNWRRLLAGDSGIVELPDSYFQLPVRFPVRLGAPVSKTELAGRIQAAVPRQTWNTAPEVCHLWLLVALEALAQARLWDAQAGWAAGVDAERVGIFVGNGAGAAGFIESEYLNVFTAAKAVQRDISRMAVTKYMASALAGQLSLLIGARGPTLTVNTACSSGVTATVLALDALRLGRIDVALCGGAEMPLAGAVLKGFANLGALSPSAQRGARASRPFDAGRDGFVLGEGAGCLVLERSAGAIARGVPAQAALRGGAATSEAHHLLAPQEGGAGMAACMLAALRDGATAPAAVGHVYTHGTGTAYNDTCEAQAIARLFLHGPTASASKAQLGHAIGAAGSIDTVLAIEGLRAGTMLPLRHLEALDPQCPIQPAQAGQPPLGADQVLLVNAFAFGGHNACLVIGRADTT
jgi:3-oxoacyl-[acyl-carrier-protein] synthase II